MRKIRSVITSVSSDGFLGLEERQFDIIVVSIVNAYRTTKYIYQISLFIKTTAKAYLKERGAIGNFSLYIN